MTSEVGGRATQMGGLKVCRVRYRGSQYWQAEDFHCALSTMLGERFPAASWYGACMMFEANSEVVYDIVMDLGRRVAVEDVPTMLWLPKDTSEVVLRERPAPGESAELFLRRRIDELRGIGDAKQDGCTVGPAFGELAKQMMSGGEVGVAGICGRGARGGGRRPRRQRNWGSRRRLRSSTEVDEGTEDGGGQEMGEVVTVGVEREEVERRRTVETEWEDGDRGEHGEEAGTEGDDTEPVCELRVVLAEAQVSLAQARVALARERLGLARARRG